MTNTQIRQYINVNYKEEWLRNALIDRIVNAMLYEDLFVLYNINSPIKIFNFKKIEHKVRKKVSK